MNPIQLPTTQEIEQAKKSSRILADYVSAGHSLSVLNGDAENDNGVLPNSALALLLNILTEMAQGHAVTLTPIHAELSLQEAADLLSVSREHLMNLVEKGEIPAKVMGLQSRILARDIIDYNRKLETARLQVLDELTAFSQEIGMGYD
jgi:excisionase family DNA binding protein